MEKTKFKKEISESSDGDDDEEDSCKRQWKRANVTLRDLKRTVHRLENVVAKKEAAIKELEQEMLNKNRTLARCEKAYRQLSQLLDAERSHFSRDKEGFFEEMMKMKRELAMFKGSQVSRASSQSYPIFKTCMSPNGSHVSGYQNLCIEMSALKAENKQLRSLIEAADEQNEELCERFLRMKEKKEEVFKKCWEIEDDFLTSLDTAMRRFNELREEINYFMDRVSPSDGTEEYIMRLARNNHDLAYENSYLRLELQSLRTHVSVAPHRRRRSQRRDRKIKCNSEMAIPPQRNMMRARSRSM